MKALNCSAPDAGRADTQPINAIKKGLVTIAELPIIWRKTVPRKSVARNAGRPDIGEPTAHWGSCASFAGVPDIWLNSATLLQR